ncbi:hypothetical protein [Azonexus hydrophilus]|uniref:hypothetical protein n=1 Tax=Azonexus hydrophilus TaxID=418702 RepID=UPI0012F7C5A5|nr:hypothetical protein [Azonexus hydrophilus]
MEQELTAKEKQQARMKAWREKNPDYSKKYHEKNKERDHLRWRKNAAENYEKYMLDNVRRRSKAKGWEFNLTIEDIVIPEFCPVLGVKLDVSIAVIGTRNQFAPSLDRVDNSKGYVKGNVRVISWKANQLKSDASLDDLKAIVAYIEAHNE